MSQENRQKWSGGIGKANTDRINLNITEILLYRNFIYYGVIFFDRVLHGYSSGYNK